jgi:hypothetical protein
VHLAILLVVFFAVAGPTRAQAVTSSAPSQDESKLGADFRGEWDRFTKSCWTISISGLPGCADLLFTDHPLHIAVGSIAPENGFGAGVAFVAHYTPNDTWRLSWNTDAVGSINGSWRAGVYMKAIFTKSKKEVTTNGRPTDAPIPSATTLERPFFNLYAQALSLNKIDYFGLGSSTTTAGRSFFGMREVIPGVNGIWPVFKPLGASLYGEINGRFVDIRGSYNQPSPSIEQVYTEATAPGLTTQPTFAQFGEGLRLQPSFGAHVKFNYFLVFQQYMAAGESKFSFRRFTVDLTHEFPIYKGVRTSLQRDFNGPDECSQDIGDRACPAITHDREGTFGIRMLISESITPAGHVVPFYFQPTLGGSDVNGNPSLSSYQDYRFRAPNVLLLRGSFEHSIYGPLGFSFIVDGGKVTTTRSAVDFSNLRHSFSAGLNLRGGGFPQVSLVFAWGGNEGTHTIASMNTSLLGGSARPSLY